MAAISLPTSSSTTSYQDYLDTLASISQPKVHFESKVSQDPILLQNLKLLQCNLTKLFIELKKNNCEGGISPLLHRRFKDIHYKHNASQRHQKFWKATQQVFKLLTKINGTNYLDVLTSIQSGLMRSNCDYAITPKAMEYAIAQYCLRIARLDKLRILCISAAGLYMGYIELGHFLHLMLMLVAMVAELATEAERQYLILRENYTFLIDFAKNFEHLPASVSEIPYDSQQKKSSKMPKEVQLILDLVNAPTWEAQTIANRYRNEGIYGSNKGEVLSDLESDHDDDDSLTTKVKNEGSSEMTQQLLSLSRQPSKNSSTIFGRSYGGKKKKLR